jgi:sugar lactone lactonase YvrE
LPFIRVAATGAVPFIPLTWEVSNPSLLTIDPSTGRAKGIKAGSVVVQVKAPGNDTGATQLIIAVVGEGAAVVKDVQVQPNSHHLVLGDTITLRAQVFMPDGQINGNVAWSSSDDTIATVNRTNGEVSALRPGRVTIIAAYAPYPEFKGIADIQVWATREEIPKAPSPSLPGLTIISDGQQNSPVPVAGRSNQPESLPSVSASQASNIAAATSPLPPGLDLATTPPSPTWSPTQLPTTNTPTPVPVKEPPPTPSTTITIAPSPQRQQLVVATLAGSTEGYADGSGPAARFSEPTGIALDQAGNLYVADIGNHRIRRVSKNGDVFTWAGAGEGYSNSDRLQARFKSPTGVDVDVNGNIFIADNGNHRIRLIAPSGLVSTVAANSAGGGDERGWNDGPVALARFNNPQSLAVQSTGVLYVADNGNHRIRKVTTDVEVTTLAGSGVGGFADGPGSEAQFNWPGGVAIGPQGEIYVADTVNHRIRVIATDGRVSTLAGSGIRGFQDGDGANARFNQPVGLAVDPTGNIFVADSGNHRIRKISQTGAVSTVAGNGTQGLADGPASEARFAYPKDVEVDPVGVIYVADQSNHRIRVIRIE